MTSTSAWVEIQRDVKRFHLNPLHFDPHGPSELNLRIQDIVVHITVQPRTMTAKPDKPSHEDAYEFSVNVQRRNHQELVTLHHAYCPTLRHAIRVLEWLLLSHTMNTQQTNKPNITTVIPTF